MHTIPANKFHRTKFKPNSSSNTASSKKTKRGHFKPRQVPKAPTGPYKMPTLYPATCPLQKFPAQGKSNISMPPQPSPLKAALMARSKLRAEMPKESVSSIIWDSGASLSITNNKKDFHGTLKPCPYKHHKVKGVAQAIKVHGQGTVLWSVLDEAGVLRTLKVPVPRSSC